MEEGDFYANVWRANVRMAEFVQREWSNWEPVSVIHVHDWLTSFMGIALKHHYKIPMIATIHATEKGRMNGVISSALSRMVHEAEWKLMYEAWRVIVCSTFMGRELERDFHLPSEKIDIIPNGIDIHTFDRYQSEDLSLFRHMYASDEERLVFSVGRMVHEKGFHVLVSAAAEVLKAHPEVKFVVAGKGEKLEDLRNRVWDLGIEENVMFTGYVDEDTKNRLYLVSDLAVFPSLYEPFGIVALEAMAAGCPVVVSNVGGLGEIVTDGVHGLVVPPGDPSALASAIVRVVENPALAKRWSENARRLVEESYDWLAIARKTLDVYRRVANERAQVEW
jgi:glycogen(starch) synthase